MQKGMNIDAVIALIISGVGMAIPEMSMLVRGYLCRLFEIPLPSGTVYGISADP